MELLLNKRELLNLGENLRGVSIACREGRCWITQAGDSRDHILSAGHSFRVLTSGKLIITATEPCRLMLSESGSQGLKQPAKALYGWFKGCAADSL